MWFNIFLDLISQYRAYATNSAIKTTYLIDENEEKYINNIFLELSYRIIFQMVCYFLKQIKLTKYCYKWNAVSIVLKNHQVNSTTPTH